MDNQLSGSAFVWQDGAIVDLGVLPGGFFSLAFDINQRARVNGSLRSLSGELRLGK